MIEIRYGMLIEMEHGCSFIEMSMDAHRDGAWMLREGWPYHTKLCIPRLHCEVHSHSPSKWQFPSG